MDSNIKSNTSFWSEITEYRIQVPYRIDGGRIDNIRKVFVEELYGALKDAKKCHLGLVFGSYNNNEKVFIAVDGQQRLTTVFLLHWYVAWRENKLNDYKETLFKFSWDTRSYSSQFVGFLFDLPQSDTVIDAIKTSNNYFSVWENDPTVKGMLTMLEEIEFHYPQTDCNLCNNLFTENCNIQYDILKLDKDSDEKTYLKMNSRGRSLTTFELFKSKFLDKYKPSFGQKFDNDWLNFMLQNFATCDNQFSDPDIPFMNFINEDTYLQLQLKSGPDNPNDYKEFTEAKVKGELIDIPFINFDKYNCVFEGPGLDSFEKFTDWICQNYKNIKLIDDEVRFKDSRFFIDAIIKDNNPNFSHRAKLFAAFKYAELTNYAEVDPELYKRWTRVFRNLVANTDIGSSNIGEICKAINKIDNPNIYCYLSKGREIDAFTKGQVAEEITKAKQILDEAPRSDGKSWEKAIIEAEKFAFFKGSIRFLFTDGNENIKWCNFDTKWANAQKYFDKDGNGVVKEYSDNAILLRYYISQFKEWGHFENFNYDNKPSTWKQLLISNRYLANHKILMNLLKQDHDFSSFASSLDKYEEGKKDIQENVHNDLVKTNILVKSSEWNMKLNSRYNCYWLYPYNTKAQWKIYVIANSRNTILSELVRKSIIETSQKIDDCPFFWGWDVNFIYLHSQEKYNFRWYRNNFVYLMGIDDSEKWMIRDKSKDSELDKYFCFKASDISGTKNFEEELNNLIVEFNNRKD